MEQLGPKAVAGFSSYLIYSASLIKTLNSYHKEFTAVWIDLFAVIVDTNASNSTYSDRFAFFMNYDTQHPRHNSQMSQYNLVTDLSEVPTKVSNELAELLKAFFGSHPTVVQALQEWIGARTKTYFLTLIPMRGFYDKKVHTVSLLMTAANHPSVTWVHAEEEVLCSCDRVGRTA